MLKAQNVAEVLERDFLEVRHAILDVAAGLDRIARAAVNESGG